MFVRWGAVRIRIRTLIQKQTTSQQLFRFEFGFSTFHILYSNSNANTQNIPLHTWLPRALLHSTVCSRMLLLAAALHCILQSVISFCAHSKHSKGAASRVERTSKAATPAFNKRWTKLAAKNRCTERRGRGEARAC